LNASLGSGAKVGNQHAPGYRPDYAWVDLQVFDRKGMIRHDGGVADLPGLYVIGLHFMRRRKSSLIDGDDARELSDHLASFLDGTTARPGEPQRIRSPLPAAAK
jgi:putative flavoprotein involved in K+ transport